MLNKQWPSLSHKFSIKYSQTQLTAARIIFNTILAVGTHAFQYMRFIVNNIPIVKSVWLGIDWQPWYYIVVDLRYNTKKFIHFWKISKTSCEIYLHCCALSLILFEFELCKYFRDRFGWKSLNEFRCDDFLLMHRNIISDKRQMPNTLTIALFSTQRYAAFIVYVEKVTFTTMTTGRRLFFSLNCHRFVMNYWCGLWYYCKQHKSKTFLLRKLFVRIR